jgi:hypothetical protein
MWRRWNSAASRFRQRGRLHRKVMTSRRRIAVFLLSFLLPAVSSAQAPRFAPQSTSLLGTTKVGTPLPFTRVWTQMPGELGISSMKEEYINLAPNWGLLVLKILADPSPVVAYMTISFGDDVIRITCRLDVAGSNLLGGHYRVVLMATDGTSGAVPVGTVVGVSDGHIFSEGGLTVMTNDVAFQPGVFPEVLPTSLTITDQLVPGLWLPEKPGRVLLKHTFTSVRPPNGSRPVVYVHQEGIPVQ